MKPIETVCEFEADGSFTVVNDVLLSHVAGGTEDPLVAVNRVCPGSNSSCLAAVNDNCGDNRQCRGLIPGELTTGLLPPNYNDYCGPPRD